MWIMLRHRDESAPGDAWELPVDGPDGPDGPDAPEFEDFVCQPFAGRAQPEGDAPAYFEYGCGYPR
jgi:hypothetical protein